ncbi:MAG: serine/threonine-protein kinase [Anaeromyxobacter sp.]
MSAPDGSSGNTPGGQPPADPSSSAQRPAPASSPRTAVLPSSGRTQALPPPVPPRGPTPAHGTQVLSSQPTPSHGTQVLGPSARPATGASGHGERSGQPGGLAAESNHDRDRSPAPDSLSSMHVEADEATAGQARQGERVRQYELIRRLGKGGMGEVFLARDTRLGRRVAIKFLHTQDPALVERFVLEARATANCAHENIVTLYEADTYQGRPYMVLEFLQGRTLAELLGGKAMPPGRAVELISPVLRALAVAHGQGIVHRDLKPENVMLTDSGVLKVLDFGIAKVLADDRGAPVAPIAALPALPAEGRPVSGSQGSSGLTEAGMVVGTMMYMSPEQWSGENVDHRSDLWAVGVMLYQLLSGAHPLAGLDQGRLARRVVSPEPLPSLRTAAPGVPSRLADAVDACLAKDPARRPDAQRLLEALAPFLPGRSTRELKVDESPYAGLAAFQEANADLFFGRTHEVAALVHRLRDEPLVAVVGPSGVGKSSFVRAGVVPALKRMGETWEALVVRPGRTPLSALAGALAPTAATTVAGSVADEVGRERDLQARLAAEPGYAGAVLRAYARRLNRRVLVFIDQLEELFTLATDRAEREAFTACLAGMADDAASPVRVIFSVRSDFLDRVFEDHRLNDARPGLFFLATPGDEGLRDALALPAELAGYQFESPAMVDELVRDLRSTDGALSLLQFAATQLWEARDTGRKLLTRQSYQQLGGIAGALARYADRVLEEVPPEGRKLARELFLRLVTRERTRAVVSLEELAELAPKRAVFDQLVEELVQARLLVIQQSERGSTAEIVHESLIHSWPTLRRWLDESGEDASFLEQLRAGARQWDQGGRGKGLLWRGEIADEAKRFHRRYRGQLPEQQQSFLDEVLAQQARAARLRRLVVSGVAVALLIVAGASLAAAVVIRKAQQEAVRQAELARAAEQVARTAEQSERLRAEELARKERERAEAAARAEAVSAELQERNGELTSALENAEQARQEATQAQVRAEANAEQARRAQARADAAAQQLAIQLRQEQERVRRLKEQFGSSLAETLPR